MLALKKVIKIKLLIREVASKLLTIVKMRIKFRTWKMTRKIMIRMSLRTKIINQRSRTMTKTVKQIML